MINLSKNNLVDVKTANSMQANLKVQEAEEPVIPAENSVRTDVDDITNPTELSDDFKIKINWKAIGKFLRALFIEGLWIEVGPDGKVRSNGWGD